MSKRTANPTQVECAGYAMAFKVFLMVFVFLAFAGSEAKAQDNFVGEKENSAFVYDEIPVNVEVEGVGAFELDVIYTNNDQLYVNIDDLFRALKIQCTARPNGNGFDGFIDNENNTYSIDFVSGQIKVGSKVFSPAGGLVKETGSLYMESSLFAEAFGIIMKFNYRSLSLQIKSKFELPVVKLQRIERMRSNIAKIKGIELSDTIVKRNYHAFRFGTLDWLINSNQVWNGLTHNHATLGLGTELLFGEADVSVNLYDQIKFDSRQLNYIWRWVDNDKRIVKQAQVGKIYNQTISFMPSQVIGAVIRNTPTTVRKATGYYTINDHTEPNWTVELYINNVLVDYTKADASGNYMFKVPIVYGYTTLKLKFYGPMGEERTEERTMNVPYSFMPAGEFEYGLSAGVLQDSSHSLFGRAEFNYGLSRKLTVGGGVEYLSSIISGPSIPFAKASFQPFSKLTINAEYDYGVKTRGLLSYYFGKSASLELDYVKYVAGQTATIFNAPEERKLRLSLPWKYHRVSGFAKIDYTQMVYDEFKFNQGNLMFSFYYKQFSANSTTQLNWIGQRTPEINTDLALSFRMSKGVSFRPSIRYNVSQNKFMTCRAEIEKRIPRGMVSVSYEKYIPVKDHYVSVNFKYDLPFARTNASVSQSKGKVLSSEGAQGSVAFGGDKYTKVSNTTSMGRGGIILYPFLDVNQNGKYDKGEHRVMVTNVRVSGGSPVYDERDTVIRIPDLNAFITYNLEFSDNNLENISWRFKNKKYQVLIDPNQFKHVDVPVIAVGEASGTAYMEDGQGKHGIGRILVNIYRNNSTEPVTQILSESGGYIYYMGLAPGDYVACVDSVQLNNLDLIAYPACREFNVKSTEDGDIIEGINFVLHSKRDATVEEQKAAPAINQAVPQEKKADGPVQPANQQK